MYNLKRELDFTAKQVHRGDRKARREKSEDALQNIQDFATEFQQIGSGLLKASAIRCDGIGKSHAVAQVFDLRSLHTLRCV